MNNLFQKLADRRDKAYFNVPVSSLYTHISSQSGDKFYVYEVLLLVKKGEDFYLPGRSEKFDVETEPTPASIRIDSQGDDYYTLVIRLDGDRTIFLSSGFSPRINPIVRKIGSKKALDIKDIKKLNKIVNQKLYDILKTSYDVMAVEHERLKDKVWHIGI